MNNKLPLKLVPAFSQDKEVDELLQSWELGHLANHFGEHKITMKILKMLKQHHMASLFKNQRVGDWVLFEHKFMEWRRNSTNAYECMSDTSTPSSPSSSHFYSSPEL